jgi:hypothetical protein
VTDGYRSPERPAVWLAPSLGRPSLAEPLRRCLLPALFGTGLGLLLSLRTPVWCWVVPLVCGVLGSIALFIDRFVYRCEVVRDRDGCFRLRRGAATVVGLRPEDVVDVVFHQGLRPELVLEGGQRIPLVASAALDELIHVAARTRAAPPVRLERRDYYFAARRAAGAGWLGLFFFVLSSTYPFDGRWSLWVAGLLATLFPFARYALRYCAWTTVRTLDGQTGRRWLGVVRLPPAP